VNTEIFLGFFSNIKFPTNEKEGVNFEPSQKYYLLLDRLSSHKTNEVKELLASKSIEPCYIVSANP